MLRTMTTCLTLTLIPPAAWAQCQNGPELFSCKFSHGKKSVHICQDGADYTYAYGRIGRAPELFLQRSLNEIHFTPWSGVGRYYWEEVQFDNKSVSYLISFSSDRLSEGDTVPEGQVSVHEDDNRLALLVCDTGSVRMNMTPLANAWHDAGFQ